MTPDDILTEQIRTEKEPAGNSSTEERHMIIEIEGYHETEGGTSRQLIDEKIIRSGTQILATHEYKHNPDSLVGEEVYLNQGDTYTTAKIAESVLPT